MKYKVKDNIIYQGWRGIIWEMPEEDTFLIATPIENGMGWKDCFRSDKHKFWWVYSGDISLAKTNKGNPYIERKV